MARHKLNSITWPNMPNDTYYLDADKVAYDAEGIYADGSTGKALQNKAEIDGYYDGMTVGTAEQLVATTFTEDDTPYNFRTAGGSVDIGDRKQVEGIVGGTVAWNQLLRLITTGGTVNGLTYTPDPSTGIVTVDGTSTGRSNIRVNLYYIPFLSGHKYLVSIGADGVSLSGYHGSVVFYNDGTYVTYREFAATATIVSYDFNANKITLEIVGAGSAGATLSNVKFIPQFIDLTQMFGSTIADYIYSLEQAQAGAGVAWFKKYFPKPYYAYNAGELMSVKALRHITRGFNAWDEEWEVDLTINGIAGNIGSKNHIPVVRGASYYVYSGAYKPSANGVRFEYFDANKNSIGGAVRYLGPYTFPDDCCYIKFGIQQSIYGTTYKNDICINLHWDGERDGEYEEYSEHVYELDPDLELRGIPKLTAGNDLYYDGDVYESDGTVTRKYGIVDLGSQTWSYQSSTNRFLATLSTAKSGVSANEKANIICAKYPTVSNGNSQTEGYDKVIALSPYRDLVVKDTSFNGDVPAFKTAMNGVYLVYELATPTTETADPFTNPQIVDDFGTEEYVTTSIVPVGHKTQYMPNLRAKLEMAPNSPNGNGTYVVKQTNGENEYVPLVIPNELPTMPTENGTYMLKVTVSNGTATLAWEAQS